MQQQQQPKTPLRVTPGCWATFVGPNQDTTAVGPLVHSGFGYYYFVQLTAAQQPNKTRPTAVGDKVRIVALRQTDLKRTVSPQDEEELKLLRATLLDGVFEAAQALAARTTATVPHRPHARRVRGRNVVSGRRLAAGAQKQALSLRALLHSEYRLDAPRPEAVDTTRTRELQLELKSDKDVDAAAVQADDHKRVQQPEMNICSKRAGSSIRSWLPSYLMPSRPVALRLDPVAVSMDTDDDDGTGLRSLGRGRNTNWHARDGLAPLPPAGYRTWTRVCVVEK